MSALVRRLFPSNHHAQPADATRCRLSGLRSIAVGIALGFVVTGCGTLNTARPLGKGERELGLTLGGPLVHAMGTVLPVPNALVEGRAGVGTVAGNNLDLGGGVNLTGLAFGDFAVEGSAAYQLWSDDRWGVSAANRIFFATNVFDTTKPSEAHGFWALDRLDLTGSAKLGTELVYAGLSEDLDFGAPRLLLAPFVGVELGGKGPVRFQLESRWLALNRAQRSEAISWVNAGSGAVAVTASVALRFGGAR